MAASTKDWLDPHGHWAVAPDAPPFGAIDTEAPALLNEIAQGTTCSAALRIGQALATWVASERARYDARAATSLSGGDEHVALSDAIDVMTHDGGPQDITARALTEELANRAGTLEHAFGAQSRSTSARPAIASSRT